jgi:hypothetical protein
MNIILCLYAPLREDIANYIIEVMGLPSPTISLDLFQLADLYKQSLPAIVITSSSIYRDETMDEVWSNVIKDEIRIRIIIIPDKPNFKDARFASKLKEAINFCIDEPTRIMNSICHAGVTMAEHCNGQRTDDKLKFGVGRIKMKDIIYGHPYNIIAYGRPYQRYIYQSNNKDTLLVGLDPKLNPKEYKRRVKLHEIPKKDILSIMKICYELREF